ncbi:uncharacterized protein LOC133724894 isoform X1 [Rosa rugosa]|uniref:uncharacterized protein LOC133724894 isoform X1 n=1 Tax=Rosa rugosa TaxID=74645 RepID=UPI002B40A1D4|nr:uncharacterized protein LOC133724894 isoform X1 [Rosa rugosa]
MLTEESGASRCWIRQCQGLRLATCIQDSGVREIKPKSSTIMGSSAQVRFQPRIGQFTDAESDRQTHSLQETLEAKIKMLRKKLTFKATPMPNADPLSDISR